MDDDSIQYDKNGNAVSFVGRDAVDVYRYALLASSIGLWVKCGMIPTRGVTITKMLTMASQLTGKPYKRKEAQRAIDDLNRWVQEMKSALPSDTR